MFFLCSKGVEVESETRDGSDSLESEFEDIGGAHSLTVSKTEEAILDVDDGASTSSNKTIKMITHSDNKHDFDPDLPTGFAETDKPNHAKGLVVEGAKPEVDEGKPEMTTKSSTEKLEASNPTKSTEPFRIYTTVINVEARSSHHDEAAKLQQEQSPMRFTMIIKKDFLDNGHVKCGRYYLPESPPFKQWTKSGLYSSLISMASLCYLSKVSP